MLTVPEQFRNDGLPLFDEFPYLYGRTVWDDRWAVWNRFTGEVVFQAASNDPLLAENEARKECARRNDAQGLLNV